MQVRLHPQLWLRHGQNTHFGERLVQINSVITLCFSALIKGRIYSACVQSVLIYGTETWAMKADDLRSLERTERGEMDVWGVLEKQKAQ